MGLFDSQLFEAPTRVVLKVDVDTKVGLRDGAARLLDMFADFRVKASFFIAMGPDNSGRALKRLFKPGFLKKQIRSGAAGAFGPLTMLYGLLIPGPIISASNPGLLNRMLSAGHEVGLHGWDHVFWHDRLLKMTPERLEEELGQAWRSYHQITGRDPASFAAPGWQISDRAWLAMERMGITHTSCTRGRSPFLPKVNGRPASILELPTTMPTMDELLGRGGVHEDNVAQVLADMVQEGQLNVFTLHGEVEGRAMAKPFAELLGRLRGRGVVFQRLVDAAKEVLDQSPPPPEDVAWAPVRGRAGEYAWQTSALARREAGA